MENPIGKYFYLYYKNLNNTQIYQKLPFALLIIVTIASLVYDGYFLFRFPIAVGIDGYYYVIQVDSLFQNGYFNFPTKTPLILFLMLVVKYFEGDTIVSIKIVSIGLHALLSLGTFLTIRNVTGQVWFGLISSILISFAGLHFYYTAEFLNNLGAIVFLIWGVFFICKWRIQKKNYVNQILATASFVGACLSHRSAVFIIFTFLFFGLTSWLLLQENISSKYKMLIISGGILIFFFPLILIAQPIVAVPKEVLDEILFIPQIPFGNIATPEKISLLIISPMLLYQIWHLTSDKKNNFNVCFFLTINLWTILITLNPFLNHRNNILGIVVRLDTLSYIQVSLLFSGIMWLIYENHQKIKLFPLLLLPFLICGIYSQLPYGLRSQFLANQFQLSNNLPYYKKIMEPDSVIIAAHGDQFLVTSILQVQSQQSFNNSLLDRKVYWLISGLKKEETTHGISIAVDERGLSTKLLRNYELIELFNEINSKDKQWLLWKNLHLRNACLGEHKILMQCN